MIHHVSIPARDPQHVASVLAELLGGYSGPFIGPLAGAYVAYAEDAHGTGIEVYPERIVIEQAPGNAWGGEFRDAEPPRALAFHALISAACDRETIEKVGKREGWHVQHFWRGPNGVKLFELYELWVENRIMLEVATPDMLAGYVTIARGNAQRELLARHRP